MLSKKKKVAMYIGITLITILVVFPFLWMVMLSFKSNSEIMAHPLSFPKSLNLENYKDALNVLNYARLYGNTLFVCVVSIVVELTIT